MSALTYGSAIACIDITCGKCSCEIPKGAWYYFDDDSVYCQECMFELEGKFDI